MNVYPQGITRALELAAQWHLGQMRRHALEQIPYIAHPTAVGILLVRAGADDETVAAGILHDVIEDCGVTKTQLAAATSERVADLVEWVTELPQPMAWPARKKAYYEKLLKAPVEALAIAAADHTQNLQCILSESLAGQDAWSMFHVDRTTKLAHERLVFEAVKARLTSPLVEMYRETLERVEALP